MKAELNPFGARFAVTWTLANVIGVSVGYSFYWVHYYAQPHAGCYIANIITGAAVGVFIGLAQGVVLLRRLVVGWSLATAIGFAIGWAAAEFIVDWLNWTDDRAWIGLPIGLFVGVAQGLMLGLRSTFARWVIVNVIGYGLGYILGYGIPMLFSICPGGQPLLVPMIGLGVGLITLLALRRTAPTTSMEDKISAI